MEKDSDTSELQGRFSTDYDAIEAMTQKDRNFKKYLIIFGAVILVVFIIILLCITLGKSGNKKEKEEEFKNGIITLYFNPNNERISESKNIQLISKYYYELDSTNTKMYLNGALINFSKSYLLPEITSSKTKIEFKLKNKLSSLHSMFEGCDQIEDIIFTDINTEEVDDIGSMFKGCSKLKSIDLSNINTDKIKEMSSLFEGCINLNSVNLSKFNSKSVKNMNSVFNGCKSLISLDIGNLNTDNCDSFNFIFFECPKNLSLILKEDSYEKIKRNEYSFINQIESITFAEDPDVKDINTIYLEINILDTESNPHQLISEDYSQLANKNCISFTFPVFNLETFIFVKEEHPENV